MERLTYFDGTSYRALSSKSECVEELGKLEDARERGLLIGLPCKLGTTVYKLNLNGSISTRKIDKFTLTNSDGLCYVFDNGEIYPVRFERIFFIKSTVEKALKEREQ